MSTATPLSVSICVLTYNRCALLRQLLEELQTITYAPLEILVVDNHSEDETQQIVALNFATFRYIQTGANIGTAARNIGMTMAKHDIIITLDDDVNGLTSNAIDSVARKFAEDPKLGAVNFSVRNPDGNVCNWVHHCKQEEFYDKDFSTYEITEGAVAFRKEALEYAGYYPETFFLSHEGPDLAFRILESGFKVIYTGDVTVEHHFASEGRKHWRNYYYDTRNQFWLAARNFPFWYAAAYLLRGMSSMFVYSLRDRYVRYWLKGVIDGLRGLGGALRERKVLSAATMRSLREIDSRRPSFAYLVKKRLLTKNGLLFK